MRKIVLLVGLGIIIGVLISTAYPQFLSYKQKRNKIISDMESLIEEKTESGEYKCCIEPACDMCFLGHWLWDDGICRCDDMIAKGENDKVCPQCIKGLEKGLCKYAEKEKCETE